jgi:hypothetical protein
MVGLRYGKRMKQLDRFALIGEYGQTLTDYAIIVLLIALVGIFGMADLATKSIPLLR